MNNNDNSLKIDLLDNCYHSLLCGLKSWNNYQATKDTWLLKEVIIWIHHGIELALKHLLIKTNKYLVFDNIDNAIKQVINQNKTDNPLELFENENSPFSVSFQKLLDRTAIILDLKDLQKKSSLRDNIDKLTQYRNKVVHFSIVINSEEVAKLVSDLIEPFLQFLESHIQDKNFIEKCIPHIKKEANPIQNFYSNYKDNIINMLKKFKGQTIKGNLFGLDDKYITLPDFSNAKIETSNSYYVDIAVVNESEKWLIKIKNSAFGNVIWTVSDMIFFKPRILLSVQDNINKKDDNITGRWLIFLNKINNSDLMNIKQENKENFYISFNDQLEEINQHL